MALQIFCGVYIMATIQVRIDDSTKAAADSLFASLGMDTSTAVRVFLSAALDFGGIPFTLINSNHNDDRILLDAINYRKAGGEFLTAELSSEYLHNALKKGCEHGK